MQLSRRVLSVAPSITLAIAAKAKEMVSQGIDVVSLSAGEPDFDTPAVVKEAAITALNNGATKYTPVAGTPELRKAIAAKFKNDQGLNFSPSQIIVSVGAKHAIFNLLFALLNEGDEVIIPSPFWLSYPEMVTVLGGKSVFIETTAEANFKITPKQLKAALNKKSKVLIINSPSNPTGAVYTQAELLALVAVLKDFPDCLVLSDEIYEKLMYDGLRHYSIAQASPEMAARTIIVNGHSKAYAMTGWRLGYSAIPDKALAQAVESIQSHSTSNPTSFAQAGGVAALEKVAAETEKMRAVFEKRRNWFYDKLAAIPKLKPFRPQGAFYMFVNIRATGLDSLKFSERLLQEAHVAVVPGKPFGANDYVRLSFAASDKQLEKAVDRIAVWVAKL